PPVRRRGLAAGPRPRARRQETRRGFRFRAVDDRFRGVAPHLALLVNPAARGGRTLRLLEPVARRLRAGGAELSMIVGDDAADALDRACLAVAERPDALVAFGGDGLVHLAVQAVAGTDVPLGIIPAGTGNDIAAALGVPRKDPLAAARAVLRMKTRPVDAARIAAGAAEELFAGVAW